MSSADTSKPPEQAERVSGKIRLFGCMLMSKFKYEWVIDDDDVLHIIPVEGQSNTISTNDDGYKLMWQLIYTYQRDYEDSLGLTLLSCESSSDIEVYARCTVHVDGSPQLLQFGTWNMKEPLPALKESPIDRPSDIQVPPDKIVILLELDIVQRERARINKLSDDLGALLMRGSASDVVFVLGDRSIRAHRAVLTARNLKLARMLRKAESGKTREMIDIKDVDGDIFEKVLYFIYTGTELASVYDRMCDLLIAADKYEIEDLKKLCEESLLSNLKSDNAADALVSAHLVNSDDVKAKIMDFVFANKDEVVGTPGYENMVKSHIYLVEEMFRRIKLK